MQRARRKARKTGAIDEGEDRREHFVPRRVAPVSHGAQQPDRRLERLLLAARSSSTRSPTARSARRPIRPSFSVLTKEFEAWKGRLRQLVAENPTATEDVIAWKLIEEMGLRGAEMLLPVFERERRLKGRLSMQTNPVNYMDSPTCGQAVHFDGLAPNIQVKIPATAAGIVAIEEVTRRGVNINATVSFTLPQAIAVAEAVERGLDRRAKEGHDVRMRPVCTLMVGRLDDWLKVVAKREGVTITPAISTGAASPSSRRPTASSRRAAIAPAARRGLSPPYALVGADRRRRRADDPLRVAGAVQQVRYRGQIAHQHPVDPAIVDELYRKFAEFRRAYDEDGLSIPEFDRYGATVRTLRSFIEAYRELTAVVRDAMLPPA